MMSRAMAAGLLLLWTLVCAVAEEPGLPAPDWATVGEGAWQVLAKQPLMIRQASPDGGTRAVCKAVPGSGNVWRVVVEPGPFAGRCGMWLGSAEDSAKGLFCSLGGTPGVGGIELRDAQGNPLWQDKYAPWAYYTPYVLEAVVEPGRLRVQVLQWDRQTLVAQSDWMDTDQSVDGFGVATENAIARFWGLERTDAASSPIVPDSPSRLRLINSDDTDWVIVGPGDWKWTSAEHRILRQNAIIERSTAINLALGGAEGVWRCRVKVDPSTGGAGMAIQVSPSCEQGFMVWLGGTPGEGGLMLYRLPFQALWSSPHGKWFYNTEYILEGTIQEGKVSARMFEADGQTPICESPAFDLEENERERVGHVGFMTWKGPAEFWGFSDDTQVSTSAEGSAETALEGWRILAGDWQIPDGKPAAIQQVSKVDVATAINLEARGTRSVYKACITPGENATAVSLLFQVSADLKEGFECRLGDGVLLRLVGGRILWQEADFDWTGGESYVVEGVVVTDRVSFRISDTEGKILLESEQCYVSDTNNAREGMLGFRCEGGAARFSDWSVAASE